jgi:hypothetical protein
MDVELQEWLQRSTRASGVPLRVEDKSALIEIAQLLKHAK